MGDIIVALATPPLKSALAVVRSSGEGVFRLAGQLFSNKVETVQERTSFVGYWSNEKGERIDQVVVLCYPAAHSLTGEDAVEIFCHGSPLIATRIINSYLAMGARYATNGEFTSRAFLHGKLDLVEAEAVNDLIEAASDEAQKLALMSLEGKSSALLKPIRDRLAALLASVEVGFDFPEYEEETALSLEKAKNEAASLKNEIDSLIAEGQEGRVVKDGLKVALVGRPNVGKSTILNVVLGEDKAIVSPIPGTTRDVVEGEARYKGLIFRFLDTAGLRENPEAIEKIGIEKSLISVDKADAVVLVLDEDRPLDAEEKAIEKRSKGKIFLVVVNKEDLRSVKHESTAKRIYLSAARQEKAPLLDALAKEAGVSAGAFARPSLNSSRQLSLLEKASRSLGEALENASEDRLDIFSSAVLGAYTAVRKLLGEEATLDLSDEIFSRFCVGK